MSLLIPAAWVPLGAGGPEGNSPSQPAVRTLTTGDARVSITVDRTMVEVGDRVSVQLVGVSDSERDVNLVVALQERNGSAMSRVPTPPTTVETERVTLAAAPGGGAPKHVSFVLAGTKIADGADPISMAGAVSQYTILVTPAGDAPAEPGDEVWNDAIGAQGAAMVQVAARRPEAFAVSIETVPAGGQQSYKGTVRIHNTTKKTLKGFNCGLSPYPSVQLFNDDLAPAAAEFEIEWSDGSDGQVAELAPGEEAVLHFRATMTSGESGTLYANVWASYGGLSSASQRFDASTGTFAGSDEPAADEPVVGMRFAQPPPAVALNPAPNAGLD